MKFGPDEVRQRESCGKISVKVGSTDATGHVRVAKKEFH